jgi:hypothetical protein
MRAAFRALTQDWGPTDAVTLYLDRCQVDTPVELVKAVWQEVGRHRGSIGKVVDFGAGDGRFATFGSYNSYIGYEIDASRCSAATLPKNATLLNQCAFADTLHDADICIGNPPYVRNQDLPAGWRRKVSASILERTGVHVSGLANAWQYFTLLALASTKDDGLVALIIPFEWVSRPSSSSLRRYIDANQWDVSVARLHDEIFQGVLTTSSITIIDKRNKTGQWHYTDRSPNGLRVMQSPTGSPQGILAYTRKMSNQPFAKRGLSPGSQKIFTLTEGERVRNGLKVDADVLPCITSLRHLAPHYKILSKDRFHRLYCDRGLKCWLVRPDAPPSSRLKYYLDSIPESLRQTVTCTSRQDWWRFTLPNPPKVLVASGFIGERPKAVVNSAGARAVGSVLGVYDLSHKQATRLVRHLEHIDLGPVIVPHSNGLRKVEPSQLQTILNDFLTHERLTQSS